VLEESIFDYLSREMRRLRYLSDDLPFDFNCGFAGYFGYELKADVEGSDAHSSTMPDAFFVFADRMIAFDHLEGAAYVLGICPRAEPEETDRWIAETALRLASLPPVEAPEWSEGRDRARAGPLRARPPRTPSTSTTSPSASRS